METDHDDPNLSQQIHSKLSKLIEKDTPADLKADMSGKNYECFETIMSCYRYLCLLNSRIYFITETLDIASKYLSQKAVDESKCTLSLKRIFYSTSIQE